MKPIFTLCFLFLATIVYSQALMPYKVGDLWGFIDTLGNEKIAPKFEVAGFFSDNRAIVVEEGVVKYIDSEGENAFDLSISEGFQYHDGITSVNIDDDWYVIDVNGDFLFDYSSPTPIMFYEKMARIRLEAGLFSKYGFINQYSDTVIPLSFELASNFNEDLCFASIDGSTYGYIDKKGKWVIEPTLNVGTLTKIDGEYDFSEKDFSEGVVAVVNDEYQYGAIDKSGKLIIAYKFQWIGKFKNGLAPAKFKNKYGYINQSGSWVIKPKYTLAEPFNNNVAAVATGKMFEEKWGLIDLKGKLLFKPFIAGSIMYNMPFVFLEGFLPCYISQGVFGYVDRKGKVIWKSE